MEKSVAINGDKRMTVKEVAAVLGYEPRTIQLKVKELFPEIVVERQTTYLTEAQVTEIKKACEKKFAATTDLEMREKTVEVMTWLVSQVEDAKRQLAESERRNAVLMHVTKTYTATEIAKELGFRSAAALNEELEKRGVQFKQNGTWVPRADFAQLGYFEIKQEVLDSGRVVYYTRITQDGRRFILDLLADMFRS